VDQKKQSDVLPFVTFFQKLLMMCMTCELRVLFHLAMFRVILDIFLHFIFPSYWRRGHVAASVGFISD